MATLMKNLMNSFQELQSAALSEGDYEGAMLYDTLVSYANNCHQMSPQETIDYVRHSLETTFAEEERLADAYAEAHFVIDYYEELLG